MLLYYCKYFNITINSRKQMPYLVKLKNFVMIIFHKIDDFRISIFKIEIEKYDWILKMDFITQLIKSNLILILS